MKNLVNFLKTKKGLLVLGLIIAAAAAFYYKAEIVDATKSDSVSAPPSSTETVNETTEVPASSTTDSAGKIKLTPETGDKIDDNTSGSTDNTKSGSTDETTPSSTSTDEPVKIEDLAPETDPSSSLKTQKDPTAYYEPQVTHVPRAVWAAVYRSSPRCQSFAYQTKSAILYQAN